MREFRFLCYCIIAIVLGCFLPHNVFAFQWEKIFGGSNVEYGNSVQQTTDGGYIIAGFTSSFGAGGNDIYLIKTDANGEKQWEKTFGGTSDDAGYSVDLTTDGGYIIAGSTSSSGAGGSDVYLIKTDLNGDKQWEKTFGGSDDDRGNSVDQTSDGGYIITGFSSSFGAGGNDIYLIKADANGEKQWEKTFGGSNPRNDLGLSGQQTVDGGYIVTGWGDLNGSYLYLIKTDINGETQWEKTFGDPHINGSFVKQTTDGGYIIGGSTWPFSTYDYWDFYLLKTDSNGDKQWEKTFGGSDDDRGYSVDQTSDGGYIISGSTGPWGGETDVYLIKTDANGDKQWEKTFGGANSEYGLSVQQTSNRGFIIAGRTYYASTDDSDVYLIYYQPDNNVKAMPWIPLQLLYD